MSTDVSPTARALLTLELIQSKPGISADQIADKLAVSSRAARRYAGILREAGIPLIAERGPYGGYRLGRGWRLPPLTFNATEALGLVMAVLDGHHDASDPADLVGGALGKIVRALPETVAAQAESVRRATAPAPDRAAVRPDPEITSILVHGCSSHRRVQLDYVPEAGSQWITEVEPWAVVVRHGRWYLLCRTVSKDVIRTYRVDRVKHVDILEQTFTPPVDLDPVDTLENHLATGWEYPIDLTIDAPMTTMTGCIPRGLGRLESVDDRTTRLVGSTSNPAWYAEQLAGIPAPFQIVQCPELRQAADTLAKRLSAAAASQ